MDLALANIVYILSQLCMWQHLERRRVHIYRFWVFFVRSRVLIPIHYTCKKERTTTLLRHRTDCFLTALRSSVNYAFVDGDGL
jgi:hypothetical protein